MQSKHAPYLLYRRNCTAKKTLKKKPIYYCQYRLADGSLSNPFSTGCTSQTEAHLYVQELINKGQIRCGTDLRFFAFVSDFFAHDSVWVRDKKSLGSETHPSISDSQIRKYQGFVQHYFLKHIQNKLISSFTPTDIKEFRQKMLKNENLSRKTINDIMSCLRIMFTSALNDGLLALNPFRGISPLITEPKPREAIPIDSAKILVENTWFEPRISLFILTAILTGMRLSEIQAIRRSNIRDTFIDLTDQYIYHGLRPLKTREARKVPICSELREKLLVAIPEGKEFVFDGLRENVASDELREFLISTMPEQRIAHGWCFHSLRHTANTYYLGENIAPVKVAAMLGHSTGVSSMQERYTNFSVENYKEIYEAQKKLLDFLIGK